MLLITKLPEIRPETKNRSTVSRHTRHPAIESICAEAGSDDPVHSAANPESGRAMPAHQALWPDYFARRGQADALVWHYRGYWSDTARIWATYYGFVCAHPLVAYRGLSHFYQSLAYRVLGSSVGDQSAPLISVTTPLLLPLTPVLALTAVAIASIPALKRRVPPLFQPFGLMGWSNYCVMLSLVFMLHGYRQQQLGLRPQQLAHDSSKTFWNKFFRAHLPAGSHPTEIVGGSRNGENWGTLPQANIVIKPDSAGAGHRLQVFRWDPATRYFRNADAKYPDANPLSPAEVERVVRESGCDMLVERLVAPRQPLPISTVRVLTLYIDGTPELICAAFLRAPEGSYSTAYFDLDAYLINLAANAIGEPLSPTSDGELEGLPLPELTSIIDTCLALHTKLPEHLQVSWDIVLSADGPVFLEGNIFPPGCDYKLTLFKNRENFRYVSQRILEAQKNDCKPGVGAQTCGF